MACTQQHRLQVLAVDVGAVGQILQQAYVSNTETCGCFICLGSRSWKFLTCSSMLFLSVRSWMRIFLIYARRNCICGFVCSYNRKKEPGGTFEVRGSSLLCLIFSVSFVASFIMLVHDTEFKKKNGSRATASLSLSFFSFSTAASAFFNRPSACCHSLALSRSRAGASSSFLFSMAGKVGAPCCGLGKVEGTDEP